MLWPLAHCPPIEDFAGFWSNRKMLSRVRWIKILEEGLEEFLVQHCICEHVQNRSFSAPVSQHGQWVEISHWALTLYVQRVALSAQQIRTVGEKRRRSTGNILSLWWGRVRKSGAAFFFLFESKWKLHLCCTVSILNGRFCFPDNNRLGHLHVWMLLPGFLYCNSQSLEANSKWCSKNRLLVIHLCFK